MKARNVRRKRTKAEIKADRERQRLSPINSPPDDEPLNEDEEEFFAEFNAEHEALSSKAIVSLGVMSQANTILNTVSDWSYYAIVYPLNRLHD